VAKRLVAEAFEKDVLLAILGGNWQRLADRDGTILADATTALAGDQLLQLHVGGVEAGIVAGFTRIAFLWRIEASAGAT